jgi:peptidoglycan/LPS O-acetylase OafA/YrhL
MDWDREKSTFNYRKDVDGLRSLAIIAVLIFHGFPKVLPGGFIGVDIFFVISGFLISGIILREIKNENFSFAIFYARRFRRLLPALLLVLLATFVGGYFLFLPDEFRALGKHFMGAGGFVANLMLWKEAGYFDSAANTKPLLHLWSLGVEEQFYLLWPLTLVLAFKQKKIRPIFIILILFVASFILNVDQIKYEMPSVFFGMSTRLWQFASGALLAIIDSESVEIPKFKKGFLSELAALLSFGAIIYSCFHINENFKYPGYWALLPTLGTTLLIFINRQSFLIEIILENPAAVFIGLISYPLYLWHWPLISFLHVTEGSTLTSTQILWALLLSFVLSVLTYKFLERPIQKALHFKERIVVRRTIRLSLGLLGVVVLAGWLVYSNDGLPSRLESKNLSRMSFVDPHFYILDHQKSFECPKDFQSFHTACCREPQGQLPQVAVWGDSLSLAIQTGFESQKIPSLLFGQGACPPLLDTKVIDGYGVDYCAISNRAIMDFISGQKNIRTVVLVSLGVPYFSGKRHGVLWGPSLQVEGKKYKNNFETYRESLRATIHDLEVADKKVIIYVTHPELPYDPKDCVNSRPFRFSKAPRPTCNVNFDTFSSSQNVYWDMISALKKEFPSLVIFNAYKYFCNNGVCNPFLDGKGMYTDVEHLSKDGGDYIVSA